MNCEKCSQAAPYLLEVVTGQGHMVMSEGIGHRQSNVATPIDFKEKWCLPCIFQQMAEVPK